MTGKSVFVEGTFTLRNLRSMGAAAIVEVLLAFGIAAILIWQQVRPEARLPPPIAVDPTVPDAPLVPSLQHSVPVPQQPEQTEALHQVQPIPTDVPDQRAQPVQAPSRPLQPQGSQASADMADDFGRAVLAAINAQKVYPRVSLLKAETGETVVSFDYVDGVVSNIHVDRSSGSRDLDTAAVQAVQRAVLPAKPAELAALDHFTFTLVFALGN